MEVIDIRSREYFNIKTILISILIATLLGINGTQKLVFMSDNIFDLFLITYGSVQIETIKYVVPVLFWCAPQLYLLLLLGNFIPNKINNFGIYLFTRTTKRGSWLHKQIFKLFLYNLAYTFTQFITLFIVGIVHGMHFEQSEIVNLSVVFFTVTFQFFLILILSNYISIILGNLHGIVTVISINILTLLFSGYLFEFSIKYIYILKYIPFTQSIITWHDGWIPKSERNELIEFYIPNYHITFSFFYIVTLVLILLILFTKKIKKMDIM
ncbi:DUF2705 family protein [Bacillus sp. UNCCL81]|uniref:DUF2705 family protein n=1 Tax=Bacillus sp. UNCCL81 TaxID=1502755 RepID=UPI0008DF05B5|nr:DUF2705 family protein [Bacillus sp. UNCCL81]SFC42573.1 hypothetical protein SAMN02799633_00765 [Bacillus sp. UNCCL81]